MKYLILSPYTDQCLTRNPEGGRELLELSSTESSKVAWRQVSTTELLAAAGQGSRLNRCSSVSFSGGELDNFAGGLRCRRVLVWLVCSSRDMAYFQNQTTCKFPNSYFTLKVSFCFNHLLLVAVLFLFFKLFIREERFADLTNHLHWQNLIQGKSQRRRPETNKDFVSESPNQLKT